MGFWNDLAKDLGFTNKPNYRPDKVAIAPIPYAEMHRKMQEKQQLNVAIKEDPLTEALEESSDGLDALYKNITDADAFVKMVHAEIDNLYLKTLNGHNEVLKGLHIIPASHVENKGNKLKKLGFTNKIEQVNLYETLERENRATRQRAEELEREITKMKALYAYYGEKILRYTDFEAILRKYNLINASAEFYKNDIPEKNIDEMLASRDTKQEHYAEPRIILVSAASRNGFSLNSKDLAEINAAISKGSFRDSRTGRNVATTAHLFPIIEHYVKQKYGYDKNFYLYNDWRGFDKPDSYVSCRFSQYETEDKLFIAAPASHFDLTGKLKIDEFTYIDPAKAMPILDKDPIAFKFLEGGYVRIISKWGTSDDRSYLDPRLK